MKKYLTYLLLLVSLDGLRAQGDVEAGADGVVGNSPYLLASFQAGTVRLRNGVAQEVALNYNVLFQQMIFKRDGGMLALDQLATVDTIVIGRRLFVPVDTVFYEVAGPLAAVPLYIHYTAQLLAAGTNIGFGSSNQTAPSENPERFRIGNVTPYDSKMPDKYKVVRQVEFLVKKKEGYVVVTDTKQLGVIFPGKEKAMRQYIRDHELVWGKVEDMEKLFAFGNLSGN